MPFILQTDANPGEAEWSDNAQVSFMEAISDPGDGAAWPVDKSYNVQVALEAGETQVNTIPAPTFLGQQLIITTTGEDATGGDRVLTFDPGLCSGNNTLTIDYDTGPAAPASQGAKLEAAQAGTPAGLCWILIATTNGVTVSTV